VWTSNIDTAVRFARQAGQDRSGVNTTFDGRPQMPRGIKAAGYGGEMGRAGLEEYTELKSCVIRTGGRESYYG
jgi:betaine-aldehyde dehydrogenase